MFQPAEFAKMYELTIPAVWRFVRSRVDNQEQAEDLTSEVYVRALAAWDRFDAERGSPTTWLCGIAAHAIQEWRRRRRWVSLAPWRDPPGADELGTGPGPEAAVLRAEEALRVRRALASLSDREREALALRFAGGLRAWEVGLILGLSAGATKMLLFRAMRRLRDNLEAEGHAPADDEAAAIALDETVDRVLARQGSPLPGDLAERLVRQLAIVHSHPVPEELPDRVRVALACPVSRVATWPGRPFQIAAVVVAIAGLISAVWRWRDAVATFGSPNVTEIVLLTSAGFAILGGLSVLMRHPRVGSGGVGLGALILAFCLWWTGVGLVVGLVLAGAAFRQAARAPGNRAASVPGSLIGRR